MNQQQNITEVINDLVQRSDMSEEAKNHLLLSMQKLNNTKINILITGATGCGKSSTINALFGHHVAKVGQGSDPETMDIQKYELNNIILWDSPGLGDGKEADRRHAKNIIDKLYEKDNEGNALIDLVLVILDGGSRDLGTSYELINEVIIPNLGDDTSRLLVAINQCDVAMKGRYWDYENNKPQAQLINFLEEKVVSTRNRIREATGVTVNPIYYSAGYKDGDDEQKPYNLSKLLMFIVNHTKTEKRAVYANDINRDETMWESDDELEDYRAQIQKSLWESVQAAAATGGEIGAEIGSFFGPVGTIVGKAIGTVGGAVVGFFRGLFGW